MVLPVSLAGRPGAEITEQLLQCPVGSQLERRNGDIGKRPVKPMVTLFQPATFRRPERADNLLVIMDQQ